MRKVKRAYIQNADGEMVRVYPKETCLITYEKLIEYKSDDGRTHYDSELETIEFEKKGDKNDYT